MNLIDKSSQLCSSQMLQLKQRVSNGLTYFLPFVLRSDYLWLRSVLLTNATVATVGLGLTIPLAFGSDLAMGKPNVFTFSSLVGATTVLVGFILVNIGTEDDNSPIEANLDENSPMELSTRATSEEIDFNSADSAETRTIS